MAGDTIAAIATAAGGGVGIIRLSGPDAISLALRHFRGFPADPARACPRRLVRGVFHDGHGHDGRGLGGREHDLDDGLAVVMPGPRTFTGEDVAELHLHGGALHLRRCLEILLAAGARAAAPGEFSQRAFLNGKLDLTRAEAIADLVAAKTDRALSQARHHLRGALWELALELREALLQLRAEVEVDIDFVDEDIPPFLPSAIAARADALAARLRELAATFSRGRLLRDGARVVLVGPVNAGKSSLFNALLRTERAIVTPIPGTTRDTLEETLDLHGVPVVLVDTAGLRATDDPVEALGITRTREAAGAADLVLRLVPPDGDAGDPSDDDSTTVVVYSKADLRGDVPAGALAISTATGEGLDRLVLAIVERLGAGLGDGDGLVLQRARQHQAVVTAADALARAAQGLRDGLPPELPAVDLQEAMDALGALVGATSIEDVLDRLFSTFCIGK